jgi:hypothetical protein
MPLSRRFSCPCLPLMRSLLLPTVSIRTLRVPAALLGCFCVFELHAAAANANLALPQAPGVSGERTSATGPTLHLDYGGTDAWGSSRTNRLSDLMYFVALISREPVSTHESSGNTQRAKVLSLKRHDTAKSFLVTCQFEISGEGQHENRFDQSAVIREQEESMKRGAIVDRLLHSILVDGAGTLTVEVEGQRTGSGPVVSEVRLRFSGLTQGSPVLIELYDVRYASGVFRRVNEMLARVQSLTFRKQPGPTQMEVTVTSVRRKSARDNAWENFVGGVKGTIANWVMPPIPVAAAGHQAILDFGLALTALAPSFTFPHARNLKE